MAFAPFDAQALTADLEAGVFQPMDTLSLRFDRAGTLTRLATFISPEEMKTDPLFVGNPALSAVAPQHTATAHVLCGDEDRAYCQAPVRLQLEDGRNVMYGPGSSCQQYDRGDLDQLPSADVAWRREAESEGTIALDNRATSASLLARHNGNVSAAFDSGCGCSIRGRSRALFGGVMTAAALLALRLRRRRRRA